MSDLPELKDGSTLHRDPKWPLLAYAPGEYLGICRKCNTRVYNIDKRALHCLPCAIDTAIERIASQSEETRELKKEIEDLKTTISMLTKLNQPKQEEQKELKEKYPFYSDNKYMKDE